MKQPGDLPPPGPSRVQLLIGLSVIAVLVIAGVTGVGGDIALAAIAVAEIAGLVLLTIIRARRHHESFPAAAAAVLRPRLRLEPRSRRLSDRADPSNRREWAMRRGHLSERLKKRLIAVGVAVWLLVLLVDRLAPGTCYVLDGGLAFTGCFAGVLIVTVFYVWAYFR